MDSTNSPTVTFQLLPDDIAASRRHLSGSGTSPFQRTASVAFVFLIVVVTAGFVLWSQLRPRPHDVSSFYTGLAAPSGPNLSILWPIFLPIVLFGFFYLLITRTKVGINTKSPILQRQSEVVLLPDAFSHSFGAITTLVRWDGIEKVISTPTHLFIFTMPQDGYPIPRRAFTSDADFAAFCEFARHKWGQARPEIPPIAQA